MKKKRQRSTQSAYCQTYTKMLYANIAGSGIKNNIALNGHLEPDAGLGYLPKLDASAARKDNKRTAKRTSSYAIAISSQVLDFKVSECPSRSSVNALKDYAVSKTIRTPVVQRFFEVKFQKPDVHTKRSFAPETSTKHTESTSQTPATRRVSSFMPPSTPAVNRANASTPVTNKSVCETPLSAKNEDRIYQSQTDLSQSGLWPGRGENDLENSLLLAGSVCLLSPSVATQVDDGCFLPHLASQGVEWSQQMETQIGAKTCDSRTPIPSRPSMIAAEPREHTPEGAGLMPRSPTVVKDAHVIQNSADLLNIKVAVDSTDTNKEDMPSAERSCDIRNCTNKRDVSESPSTRNEAEPKKLRSQGHINTDPKLGVCPEGSYTADTQLVMGFVQSNRVQKMSPTRGQSDSTHTLSPTQVYSLAPIKDHGSDFTGQRIGISVPDSLIGLHQHSARDPACHADTNIIGPSALPSSLPGTQQASCQSQTAQEQPESTQIQGNSLPLGESQSVLSFTDSMFIEAENNFGTLMAQVVAKNDSYIIVESKEPQADIAPWVFTSAARPALSGSILGEAENNDMKVTEQAAGSASVETKDPRVSVEASTLTSPAARPEFTDSMFIEAEKNFMEIMAQAAPKRVVESKDPHAKINTITLTKSDGVSEHEVAALAEECIRDEVIQDAQTAPTTMPGFIMGGKVVVVSQQKLEESRAKFGPILSGLEALTASDDVCQLQSLRSTGNSTLRKNSYQPVGKDTPSMKGFGGIAPFKLPKFKNGGPNGPKSGFPINSEVANFTGISTSSMSTLQKPNISRKPMLRSRPLNNGTNIVCTDESTQQVTSWSAGLGKADATGIGLPVSGVLAMQLETIESAPGNRENRRVCEDCSILQTSSTGDNADEIARNGNFVMGGRNVVVDDKVILVAKGALGLQADKKAFETVNNEEEAIRRTALATGCETAKLIPPASATALQSSSRINAASFAPILRTAQANQSSGNEIGGHSAIPGIPSAVVVAVTPRHSRIQTSTAFKPPMPRLSLPKNDVNGTVMQSGVPRKRRSTRSSYQRRSIQRVHIRGSK